MWNSLRVHSMSSRHASADEKEWYSSCEHAVRFLLYNSDVGAPFAGFQQPSLKFAQLSCSFASQHTHVSGRCRRRGVWRGGVEDWVRAKSQRLPVTLNKCVWSEIREGKTHKNFSRGAPVAAVWVRRMLDNWSHLIGWSMCAGGCVLTAASFLCAILNQRSNNSSETGCPIGRQIPMLDRAPCSWPLSDLGSNKS